MKKTIFLTMGIILIFSGLYFFSNSKNTLNYIESSYKSMSIEIMSVPKDTTVDNKKISDKIIKSMQLKTRKKWDNFEYDLIPNRIIINIDQKYVFWFDERDEKTEICKITRFQGPKNKLTGIYKIPHGTVEKIEQILNNNNLKWNNLN